MNNSFRSTLFLRIYQHDLLLLIFFTPYFLQISTKSPNYTNRNQLTWRTPIRRPIWSFVPEPRTFRNGEKARRNRPLFAYDVTWNMWHFENIYHDIYHRANSICFNNSNAILGMVCLKGRLNWPFKRPIKWMSNWRMALQITDVGPKNFEGHVLLHGNA